MTARPTVRVLRSLEELASVRDAWCEHQWHPWGDYDYYVGQTACKEGYVRPNTLVVEEDGRVVALVAASVHDDLMPWRLGSLVLLRTRARTLQVGTGSILGDCSGDRAEAVAEELMRTLEQGEFDLLHLQQIPGEQELLSAVRRRASPLARDRFPRSSGGGILELPASWDDFLKSRSRSSRKGLRSSINRIRRELGPELRLTCLRRPEELETLIADSVAVAQLTYQETLGVGFRDRPQTRRLLEHAAEAGWLRGYLLYIGDRPIAFWHGLLYRGTFLIRDTGFDPELSELSPGTYLLSRVVEALCEDPDCQRIDFGAMQAEYKRRFSSYPVEFVSTYVFGRSLRGRTMTCIRTLTGAADRSARALLGSERSRKWMRRLASGVRGAGLSRKSGATS